MKKSDWFLFIGFILIIASLMIITYYVFTEKVNDCTSDPLKFAVNKIKEKYESSFVRGNIHLISNNKSYDWYFGDEYNFSYIEN